MIEVIRNLNDSHEFLQIALDKYLDACVAFQNYFTSRAASRAHHLDLLMSYAANEFPFLIDQERTLGLAKSSISAVRNHSFKAVPVNSLPSEILAYIFNLVLNLQIDPRKYARHRSMLKFPGYPDTLAQVCFHWRQVALATGSLWSYLDFSLYHVDEGILHCAERFKSRTNGSPVQLDINGSERLAPDSSHNIGIFLQFLAGIAPQIRALTLAGQFNDLHFSLILGRCFSSALPEVLTQLTIVIHKPLGRLVESIERPKDAESIQLELPEELLESFWLPVTHLTLCGAFPRWSSNAYRGLVELRLIGRTSKPPITDVQLFGILEASPGLRLCRSNLPLIMTDSPIAPVYLRFLEVLTLSSVKSNRLGRILRLISLGPRPLQFYLTLDDSPNGLTGDLDSHVEDFFTRTQISKLIVKGVPSLSWVSKVYEFAPRLQALVLESCNYPSSDLTPLDNQGKNTMRNPINHLYLSRCEVELRWLQWVLRNYPVHGLTTWRCNIVTITEEESSNLPMILAESCSVVNILGARELNPLLDWC